jgi:hypothetical protein
MLRIPLVCSAQKIEMQICEGTPLALPDGGSAP